MCAAAAGLLRIGVRVGDRVGLWSPNRAEWPIVQYATAEIGAILVNINPAYRQTELEYALNQSGWASCWPPTISGFGVRGDARAGAPGLSGSA